MNVPGFLVLWCRFSVAMAFSEKSSTLNISLVNHVKTLPNFLSIWCIERMLLISTKYSLR